MTHRSCCHVWHTLSPPPSVIPSEAAQPRSRGTPAFAMPARIITLTCSHQSRTTEIHARNRDSTNKMRGFLRCASHGKAVRGSGRNDTSFYWHGWHPHPTKCHSERSRGTPAFAMPARIIALTCARPFLARSPSPVFLNRYASTASSHRRA
jgi:hypothetical protein